MGWWLFLWLGRWLGGGDRLGEGIRYLIKGFPSTIVRGMLWYGGSIEQRRSLAHEQGTVCSWRGRSTLYFIRRYEDYSYRSLLPLTRLGPRPHACSKQTLSSDLPQLASSSFRWTNWN